MRHIKTILCGIVIGVSLISCQKKPEASFTTDKQEYIAGETVHLTNTSTNAHWYDWSFPNGQSSVAKNTDYLIDRNTGFAALTFKLNADSENGKKSSTETKSVNVIPSSFFSVDSTNFIYYPMNISNALLSSIWQLPNWQIRAAYTPYSPQGLSYYDANAFVSIQLAGTSAPTTNTTYNLQSNDTLPPGYAYIWVRRYWWEDNWEDFVSTTGQLTIDFTNGKMHAVFNHINAQHTNNLGTTLPDERISGDITCH